jgi:sugar transferase (PEP-CTERM/EpsH1 system associated)
MKPRLLFLCHRIPYPPNKGDKIRSYHLLKFLAEHYQIHLGAFIDDEQDQQYRPIVEQFCEQTCFITLNTKLATLKSAGGLLTGKPLSLPYYTNKAMQNWVLAQKQTYHIDRVVIYSSVMAQFIQNLQPAFTSSVVDFVDIDSDKWLQYAHKQRWPMSWVYRREGKKLLSFEKQIAALAQASLFVSTAEADMFKRLAPQLSAKISFYNNGVDTEYFKPSDTASSPYPAEKKIIVFTGAMDYWPNSDAVYWYATQILPKIVAADADVEFYIVGSNPSQMVLQLAKKPNINVTGRVADIRPYMQFADIAVAPMRVARGVQNKVLEAMAMEVPVIVSQQGLEGISAVNGQEIVLAGSVEQQVSTAVKMLSNDHQDIGAAARQRVLQDFNWHESLPIVKKWIESSMQQAVINVRP